MIHRENGNKYVLVLLYTFYQNQLSVNLYLHLL